MIHTPFIKKTICLLDHYFSFLPICFFPLPIFPFLCYIFSSVAHWREKCCANYLIKFWQKFNHIQYVWHTKKKSKLWLKSQESGYSNSNKIADFLLLTLVSSEGSRKGHEGDLDKCNYPNVFIRDRSFFPHHPPPVRQCILNSACQYPQSHCRQCRLQPWNSSLF